MYRSLHLAVLESQQPDRVVTLAQGLLPVVKSWVIVTAKSAQWAFFSAAGLPGVASIFLPGFYYGLYLGLLLTALTFTVYGARRSKMEFPWRVAGGYLLGGVLFFLAWLTVGRESSQNLSSRLLFPFVAGTLAWGVWALRAADAAPCSPRPRWRLLTGVVLGLLLVCFSFVADTLAAGAVERVVRWGGFHRPLVQYQALLARFAATAGFGLLVFLLLRGWTPPRASRRWTLHAILLLFAAVNALLLWSVAHTYYL